MKKISLYIAIVFSAFTISSCKKYLDVNATPNLAIDAPPKTLLPTTTLGMAWTNGNALGRAASIIMQYNSGVAGDPDSWDVYNLEGSFENQWNFEIYNGTINNLRKLIANTQQTDPAYSGIAKIEMAYVFSLATDLFGDIPYSQGGFGLEFQQPRFDKQQDIYLGNSALGIQSLFNVVREGLADLEKPSTLKPTTDDLIYGGDLTKWKRAGNTLLMKLAMQVSNVAPDTTKSVITSVLASNMFINDNSLDFQLPFSKDINNQNPFYVYDYLNRPSEQMMSARLLTLMKNLNDTIRLSKYYTKPTGVFIGYDNGSNVTSPVLLNRSRYGAYIIGPAGSEGSAPIRLLTNFQRLFIQAESALLFGTAGNPDSLYMEGIRASMRKTGMTETEISNYFNSNTNVVTLTGTIEDKRKQIITQKYIAWLGNGIEAYNDYRRTGYPTLNLAQNAVGDDPNTIPKRFPYSTTEASRNPNQPNPRPRTNVKVWWGL